MQILKMDFKESILELVPDSLDDLWHLEKVIESGDRVSGSSTRKIKPKHEGDKAERIHVFIKLETEQAEFHKFSGKLRVSGIILEGKPEELVELKSHHSIEFEPGTKIRIEKDKIKKYQAERLEKARKASGRASIIVVLLDDETASVYSIKEFGSEERAKILAEKQGKRYDSEENNSFFDEIISKVTELEPEIVIIAGPGFTREKIKKKIDETGCKFKIFSCATNSVGKTGLSELLKSDVVGEAVSETVLAKEEKVIEKLFEEIGKGQGKAVYGISEVENAAELGAVEVLLVNEKNLLETRERIEKIMEVSEKMQGQIHIVSQENEAGQKLESIGGVAAILRYAVSAQ